MPTLILLPGMDGTGTLFENVATILSAQHDVKIVSYPSQVLDSPASILDLIQSTIDFFEPFILIAESYSTPIAIQFAARYPKNLVGLVLCAGFATSPVDGWLGPLVRALAPVFSRVPIPAWLVRLSLLNSSASDELVDGVRSAIASVTAEVLTARLVEIVTCDTLSELSKVDVPILYLKAERDRLVPARCLREIMRVRPKIQVATLMGPHLILQTKPEEAAQVILQFVRKHT